MNARRQLSCEPSLPKESAATEMRDAPTRAWLLALLRYAVTHDETDRSSVLAIAAAIDCAQSGRASFNFFRRTSLELCSAIVDEASAGRAAIIRRHLDRVEDPRLRCAFAAAAEVEPPHHAAASANLRRPELWRGLA